MDISIIGGGIGGLCTAIALQRQGHSVKVFERSENLRPIGAGLALGANAIMALQEIGLAEEIIKEGKVLKYLSILDKKGRSISVRDTVELSKKYGIDNFTIHRASLQKVLLENLLPDTLFLGFQFRSFKQSSTQVEVTFENGEKISADCLIAADGVHSAIRKMLVPTIVPRYSGYTCWRAVIEKIPSNFDDNIFSETWSSKGRFGIAPLKDGKVYWYACLNALKNDEVVRKYGVKELQEVFKGFHFPIPHLISLTENHQLIQGDIIDLPPLEKFAFEKILLVGDSAHATTPNMGQGACQAIEDAIIVSKCLTSDLSIEASFKKFEILRMKRTRKIVKTSWILGKIAQLSNPGLCQIRDIILRSIPNKVNDKQLEFLYNVNFRDI